PMAAMTLTVVLAIAAAAQQQVPFNGTLQGQETVTACSPPQPTCVVIASRGTGIGAHLGQFSFTQDATVNLAALTETGSAHWVAANGDTIDTTVAGSAEPSDIPNLLRITEIHTITGGTGRFTGAQGSFTVDRLHNQVPSADGTHFTSGSFHGTITSPSAA